MITRDRAYLLGEDLEELLAEIGLSFGIELTVEDFVESETVGALFDRVLSKAGDFDSPKCLTSVAFYRLRRLVVDLTGRERRTIQRTTLLEDLVPWRHRRSLWKAIEARSGFRLPQLQLGGGLLLLLLSIAAAIAVEIGRHAESLLEKVGLGLICTLGGWIILLILTRPLHRAFPERAVTFEDLVGLVVAHNHGKLTEAAGGSTRDQAWVAFRDLVARAAVLEPSAVTREMKFPEDLGIS